MRLIEQEAGKTFLHPVVLLGILAVGLAIGLLIPEGGISWSLFGFEEHQFTVGEEQISLRVDTSGIGPYQVESQDGGINVIRCGTVLWEGGFVSAEECAALQQEALAAEGRRILEHAAEAGPASLICSGPAGGAGYVFMTQIGGSGFGAVFHTPDGSALSEKEALEYAHRLQLTRLK